MDNDSTYMGDAMRDLRDEPLRVRLACPWNRVRLDAMVELVLLMSDRLVEEGDCLLWTGAVSEYGAPKIWVEGGSDVLRRLIWTAIHGTPGKEQRIGVGCGVDRCVEPLHLKVRTRSEELSGIKRSSAFGAKIAATKRAASTFTQEEVDYIRSSALNNVQLGIELNRNHQTIARIRSHDIWRSYVSPFAGLGARG